MSSPKTKLPAITVPSHFTAVQQIYTEEISRFYYEQVNKPTTPERPPPRLKYKRTDSEEADKAKHLRTGYNTSFTKRVVPTPSQHDHLALARQCIGQLRSTSPMTHAQPSRRIARLQASNARSYQSVRSKGLGHLMEACKSVEAEQTVCRTIAHQQRLVTSWRKNLEMASDTIASLSTNNSAVLKDLYFFNRDSKKFIIDEFFKQKKAQQLNGVKLSITRRQVRPH